MNNNSDISPETKLSKMLASIDNAFLSLLFLVPARIWLKQEQGSPGIS